MGYFIEYHLSLRIKACNVQRALDIFNHLHTPEMLEKHARGGSWPNKDVPTVQCKWYSWVGNPAQPYVTLKEAFINWAIVESSHDVYESEETTGDFVVKGSYDNKYGQQDFLLSQLACVLEDTTIKVVGEDGAVMYWIIDNYQYREGNSNNQKPSISCSLAH